MNKVSVIMPCYNDGAYISESIASVKAQTYPSIEMIIIDDGSDDEQTKAILDGLSKENVKILHTNHVGPSAARNEGISVATGKYILPVDSDDIILPTYIEKAVSILDKRPDVGVVYCHAEYFGEKQGPWELPEYNLTAMLLDNIIFVTSMFRKQDWVTVGGFCHEYAHGMEDYDFWLSILQLGREVVQLPETLFKYRIKKASRTTRFMDDYGNIQHTYELLYQRHKPLYQKYMDIYCMTLRRTLIDHSIMLRNMREETPKQENLYEKTFYAIVGKLNKHPALKKIIKAMVKPFVCR